MKYGVSSYSFDSFLRHSHCDYLEICDIAHKIGFDGIEFIELDKSDWHLTENPMACAEKIREHCDKLGLEIPAYTVSANLMNDTDREIERLFGCVDVAQKLGASVLRHDVCWSLPKEPLYTWRNAIEKVAPAVAQVSRYAKQKGIRTCSENHGFIFQAPERMEALILAVGEENYGWLCDIGNFLCADVDPVKAVAVAAPYTMHVHVKDFLLKNGQLPCPPGFFDTLGGNHLRGTIVGHGVVPVRQCLSILKKSGYDGWISLEFEGPEASPDAIQTGFSFLKQNG